MLARGEHIDTEEVRDDVLELVERVDRNQVFKPRANNRGVRRRLEETFEFSPQVLHGAESEQRRLLRRYRGLHVVGCTDKRARTLSLKRVAVLPTQLACSPEVFKTSD